MATSNQLPLGLGALLKRQQLAISPSHTITVSCTATQAQRFRHCSNGHASPQALCCVRFVPLLLRHRRSLSFSSHADTEKIDDDDAAARRPATARKGVRRAYQFLSPSSPSFSSPSRHQLSPQHLAPQCARKERKRPAGTQNSEDLLLRQKIRLT